MIRIWNFSIFITAIITLDIIHAMRYYKTMIVSFKCSDTETLANGGRVRRFVSIESVAIRKLRPLQIAGRLEEFRIPPGIRLESLKGAARDSIQFA